MAERPVLRMGHPDLHRVARPVEAFDTPELHALVADLWETMAAEGGIGLAATQIGVSQRVVVFGLDDDDPVRERLDVPRTVLVNPVIEPLDDRIEDAWEGCLSLPGMRGVVPRWARVRYGGHDQHGAPIEREVDGFHARVVQHECDHLDGILYPLRMRDLATFGYDEELGLAEQAVEARCEV